MINSTCKDSPFDLTIGFSTTPIYHIKVNPCFFFVTYLLYPNTEKFLINRKERQVYSYVRILAEAIASLSLHLHCYAGKSKERVYDYPLYHILRDEPNPEMTSFIFRETMMPHLLLWGNAYADYSGWSRPYGVICPLLGGKMTVDRDWNGRLVDAYTRNADENPNFSVYGKITLGWDDIRHIPRLGFEGWQEALPLYRKGRIQFHRRSPARTSRRYGWQRTAGCQPTKKNSY